MDRVLKQAEGMYNNMAFQMEEKILAAISLFHYTLINGDKTTHSTEFDGLDKMLAGQQRNSELAQRLMYPASQT